MPVARPLKALLFMLQHLLGNNKKGLSLIEILVSIAIISTTLVSLLGLTSFSLRITSIVKQTNRANNMAQEIMEQIRNFRDVTSWNTDGLGIVIPNIDYYVQKSGTPPKWQLVPGAITIDGFTKKAVFEVVKRDSNDDIVETGGIEDPDTKKVIVTVSWQERENTRQLELISYFTNWK